MSSVEWNENYSVGVKEIDIQHRHLFEIFSTLLEAESLDGAASALTELKTYTYEHFELEEKYMAECEYPDLEGHRRIHEAFRKKTETLCSAIRDDNLMEILSSLYDWLVNHVCACDQQYAPYMANRVVSIV